MMTQLESKGAPVSVSVPESKPVGAGPQGRPWLLVSVAVVVLLLAAWWAATTGAQLIGQLYFPTPESVVGALMTLNVQLAIDAAATLSRVIISWIGGSSLGVLVGLLMARSKWVFAVANPIVEAVRPVPPVALIPFVILWFGIGDSGKIFLGSLACFMVMVVNTTVACSNVPPVYLQAARSLGASSNQVYRTVILPAIVPEILSGFRIGSALAFAVIVAAEFLGADAGIGRLIMSASRTLNTPVVLLGTVVIAILAVLLDAAILRISAYVTRWSLNR
jgi:ABC-type nitrate/sulfonate/bicarbonate transport system permease component